jgi:hypothetical protein
VTLDLDFLLNPFVWLGIFVVSAIALNEIGYILSCRKKKKMESNAKRPLRKRTQEIVFSEQSFDVGVTKIKITFKDKRTFVIARYGAVHQSCEWGQDEEAENYRGDVRRVKEPEAGEPRVYSSLQCAQNMLQMNFSGEATFVNDEKNPTEIIIGEVIGARIISTKSHMISFNVASVRNIPVTEAIHSSTGIDVKTVDKN